MQRHDDNEIDAESPRGEFSSVGETLREAREALDLKIEQLAADLRIEVPSLVALEADDFDEFSAPVFAKGYLKQYSLRLGLDDAAMLTLYDRQVGTQHVPKLRIQTLELNEDQQQSRWLIGGSAVAFIVAALLIWQLSTPEAGTSVGSASIADVVESESVDIAPAVEPPAAIVAEPAPVEPIAAIVDDPADLPADLPEEVVVPELQVEIVFHEDCWTEVIDARGERLFYGLGSAGAQSRFSATPPLSFFLGNASGVDLSVDDMPYEIPDQNRQGNLARFVILESGD
jgi:cytoskeleton protein RodZ